MSYRPNKQSLAFWLSCCSMHEKLLPRPLHDLVHVHMQGIAIKQLSYVVDPCLEHTPQPAPTATPTAPAASKPGSKPVQKGAANSTAVVDRASRSLVQAFQQDVLAVYGKEWTGITGNASYLPTDTQYGQLLREATGFVYCGMCRFVEYVAPAVVLQADMRSCELALLLDGAQTAKSVKRQMLHRGCVASVFATGAICLADSDVIAK